jgi:radical SAM superfamily enzyme YgiQ (UPF0313 family)
MILFINPSTYRIYDTPEKRPILEPLWAEQLSAYIGNDSYDIFDMNLDSEYPICNPTFICISVVTPLLLEVKEIIKECRIKYPNAKIILGGPHISIFKGQDSLDANYKVVGEGESVFNKIIDGEYPEGIIFSQQIDNLDSIPFSIRIDRKTYRLNHNINDNIVLASVMSSRSCPYQCIYCASKEIFGTKMRYRSPGNVLAELEQLQAIGVNTVIFIDDCFTLLKDRVHRICDLIIEKGLNIKWWIDTRADTIDEDMLVKMKQAGCSMIVFGVESGNQNVLNRIRKNITLDKIEKAFELTKKVGIETKCNMMLGHLDETREEILDTIAFAKKVNPTKASFYKVIPLPGSPLYQICIDRKLITGDEEEFKTMAWYKSPPIISMVSSAELEELQQYAYKEFV